MRISWVGAALAFCSFAQSSDYAPDKENAIFKTVPGKQLYQEDVRCGEYFWKSEKAAKGGGTVLYFFYGDPAYGKGKLGMYKQNSYRVVVSEDKDPPTAQVINEQDRFKEVLVRMTKAQFEMSKGCFR